MKNATYEGDLNPYNKNSSGEFAISQFIADHYKASLFHHAHRNATQLITLTRPTW